MPRYFLVPFRTIAMTSAHLALKSPKNIENSRAQEHH
jgi:hypothetical protein